jgi:hypothetical protein
MVWSRQTTAIVRILNGLENFVEDPWLALRVLIEHRRILVASK